MTQWLRLLIPTIFAPMFFLPLTLSAQMLTREQKLDDYHQLVQNIRAMYGPYEFKNSEHILDIPAHFATFETRVANSTGNSEFYSTMLEFVAGFKDGHFGMFVPTSHRASLSIGTDLIEGKVLIVKINRERLPVEKFPFQIGDEILTFNGKPVSDELDQLSLLSGSGNPRATRRMAAWQLLRRSGMRMTLPKEKSVSLTIRRGNTALSEEIKLDWSFSGKPVDENISGAAKSLFKLPLSVETEFGVINNDPVIQLSRLAEIDFACNPKTRIAVPSSATWILQEPFTAYTYETPKGRVGYLRIPHYSPPPRPGQSYADAFEEWFDAYRFAVKKLEDSTVGLIVDQDHNCGGSVPLVENTAALFMNRPFSPMLFSFRASKAEVLDWQSWVATAPEGSLITENYKKIAELLETTWKKAPGSMTSKVAITGRDIVPVDPVAN